MIASGLSRLAVAAALTVAPLAAGAAEISPEVRTALARGDAQLPVLITLRGAAGRRPSAASAFAAGGFAVRRRLACAPVVAGDATSAGIAALAARPDVRHVGLDRAVRPAGQVGTAQIGADRLLGIGVTGLGRSIAVVDSGIDLQHPDLRSPNGTPWPGFNIAEGTGDLADCSGHGTEVAGVLAGPQGLAPEAGLVVLKVFDARDGCRTALASDVLAAVDWAVAYAPGTGLEAINLSLADDAVHAGFCDADDPAGAAVFASARDAGLSVVAAAGNNGRTDGLPWPACLSSVASVGMVYSLATGPVQWGGAAACTDLVTGPDVVPCASNTGSGLSVLAPGVGWTTTAEGGGQTSGFSGTSAAAPATAGALLLARQARPLADPGLAIDLLRATGVPVRDARTGLTAPRVDLGAALAASTPISGSCPDTPIPDGARDGLVCDASVSSLVGSVSTLLLALAVDHPDPTQLVVTLTGPDGTRVTILDHEGHAGEAVREVFGLTAAPAEALSAFEGRPLEGTWRLTVADTVPGGVGRVVSWALFVEPLAPEPEPAFPGATSFVATSAHLAGKLGAFYTTDLRLFNADPAAAHDVLLRFSPSGGGVPRTLAIALPPLTTRVLDDVVHDAFRTDGYGPLFLSAAPAVVAATRTSTTAPRGGSFGLAIPANPAASAVGAGATLVLVPAIHATGFRVNVGVTEVTGKSASVEILIRGPSGVLRSLIPRTVPASGLVQLNDIYEMTGLVPGPADRIEVRVTGGAGRITGWATPIDDSTNDGSWFAARAPSSNLVVPSVVRGSGPQGSSVATDLTLSNAGAAPIRVRIVFSPSFGQAYPPATVALQGYETLAFVDVLGALFLSAGNLAGALRITALDGGSVYASTRVSTSGGGRSYGFAIDPVATSAQAGPGRQLALTFLSSSPARLTNVGFVETSGAATSLRATLLAPDGTGVGALDFSLAAFQAIEWNDVFAQLQAAPLPNASLLVDVLTGGSAVAYATVVDNRTNDTSYFPAVLVPPP
jgi:hypothetical protein